MKRVAERFLDFPSIFILTMILLTVGERLLATGWATELVVALALMTLGLFLGLALGASWFGRLGVSLLAVGFSLPVFALVNGQLLYTADIPWLDRMVQIGQRLWFGLIQFLDREPVPDTLLFVFAVSIGAWTLSLVAGYALTRSGNFTAAVLPAGIALLLIHLADSGVGDRAWVLAIYFFLCLLLLGRIGYAGKHQFWKTRHVWVPQEARTYFNLLFIVAALAIVFVAWTAPTSPRSFDGLREMWDRLTNRSEPNTDLENAIAGITQEPPATGFYGDTLPLGRQGANGDDIFLRVRAPVVKGSEYYYWRVRTYELFEANSWASEYGIEAPFTHTQSPFSLEDTMGLAGEFTFTAGVSRLAVLVTPAHPIWVNHPSIMTYSPAMQGSIDPIMFEADPPVEVGKQYSVHANLYNPTVTELRAAGEEYPLWVTTHYLQLPEDLSPQIVALAQEITAGAETNYDKAVAITEYLRANITYSLTADYPETETDLLTWFLFESRTGFCNYYATAEVILLRSVGIPARLVVGFAQGEFDPPNFYTVRRQDEHAWPEAYFPGIGWVEFEPTVSQPRIVRLLGEELPNDQITPTPEGTDVADASQPLLPVEDDGTGTGSDSRLTSIQTILLFLGIFFVLFIGFFVAYTFGVFDRMANYYRRVFKKPVPVLLRNAYTFLELPPPGWLARWAYFAELTPMQKSFTIVYRSLRWIRERTSSAQTPAQAAAALTVALPQASQQIQILLDEYQRSTYGPTPGDAARAGKVAAEIRSQAMRLAIRRRWQAIKRPFVHLFNRNAKEA